MIRRRLSAAALILFALCVASQPAAYARQSDASKASARAGTPEWVRDGVIYEIYPRDFSEKGNFEGVTAELDRLKNLGVNILWLMPIHPRSEERRVGKECRS